MGADWGLTNTTRDALYSRKAALLRLADECRLLALRGHPQSDDFWAVLVNGDEDGALVNDVRISAAILGTDTDAAGMVYLDVLDVSAVTASGGRTFTFAASGNTLTASSGHFEADGYRIGMAVTIAGTSSNNATRTITNLSATVMTFASGIVDEGPLSATASVSSASAGVDVYNDQARTQLVATGIVEDSDEGAVAPESGYTFAATIALGEVTADVELAMLVVPPVYSQLDQAFDGDFPDDAQNEQAAKRFADEASALLLQAAQRYAAAAAEFQRSAVRRLLVSRSSETVLINEQLRRLATGQVDKRPIGLLEDERLAQAENTAGDAAIKFGAGAHSPTVSYATGWTGRHTTPTLGQRAVPGGISFMCSQGLNDSGPPQFTVLFDPDDTRRKPRQGRETIRAPFPLTLGATYRWPEIGLDSFSIDYEPTIDNDSGDTTLDETASYWSVTGLRSSNSDGGKLYTYYDSAATLLEFYRTEAGRDARDEGELVTQAILSADSTVFTSEDTGTGLRVTGRSGTRVNTDKGEIDFLPPSSTQPAARATIRVDQTTKPSLWVELVRDGAIGGALGAPEGARAGWDLNTGTPVRVPDSLILRGHALGGARLFRRRS